MAELKTKPNKQSISVFLKTIDEKRQGDCQVLLNLMIKVTGEKPTLWGDSIVGFGQYHYKYKSGREGDWFITGFSPRKQSISVYIMPGFSKYQHLLDQLGKHKTSVSCLYIKKLADVDLYLLEELVAQSVKDMTSMYITS